MKPDAKGCLRVFVGGKYLEWTAVQNDDDTVILVPARATEVPLNPNQLSLDSDPEIDLKDLNPRRNQT